MLLLIKFEDGWAYVVFVRSIHECCLELYYSYYTAAVRDVEPRCCDFDMVHKRKMDGKAELLRNNLVPRRVDVRNRRR